MKTVVVTGASGGLGEYLVTEYLKKDYKVFGIDNNKEKLEILINKLDNNLFYSVPMDITNEIHWDTFCGHLEEGNIKINYLINTAGKLQLNTIEDTSLEQWNDIMAVNATGTFLAMNKLLKFLIEGSSIVNVSSIASFLGSTDRVAYAASKGAVSAMTKAASIELAPKSIRVNSVHPAYIQTQMADIAGKYTNRNHNEMGKRIPLYNRISTVDEVGEVIIFLNSNKAKFVTGIEMVVDGGQSVN